MSKRLKLFTFGSAIVLIVLFIMTIIDILGERENVVMDDSIYPTLRDYFQNKGFDVRMTDDVAQEISHTKVYPCIGIGESYWEMKDLNLKDVKEYFYNPIVVVGSDKDIKKLQNNSNWFSVLSSSRYTMSDPKTDPLGFYVDEMFQLEGSNLKPVKVFDDTVKSIRFMQSGGADYAFTFLSYAQTLHLNYFLPPCPYNIGNCSYPITNIKPSIVGYVKDKRCTFINLPKIKLVGDKIVIDTKEKTD